MCGLSQTYPICHGDHARTRNEEDTKVYIYDQQGNRIGEFKESVDNLRKV
jgi:CDGSH-type Zn-finger protein